MMVLTRDIVRSRRKRDIRSLTINLRRRTQTERATLRALYPNTDHERPRTRSECIDGARPCPFVACKHNLFLDVGRSRGSLKLNFPDLDPDQLEHSCALDVADSGPQTLERVAELMNMTRERVRQIEERLARRLRRNPEARGLLRDILGREPRDEREHHE